MQDRESRKCERPAFRGGRVATHLIETRREIPGRIDAATGDVVYDDLADPEVDDVLDDLGTESATAWAKEKLYQLFNHRYNAKLPTVITTASNPDDIEPRLASRIFDETRGCFFVITAPAYRGGRSKPTSSGPATRTRRPRSQGER